MSDTFVKFKLLLYCFFNSNTIFQFFQDVECDKCLMVLNKDKKQWILF